MTEQNFRTPPIPPQAPGIPPIKTSSGTTTQASPQTVVNSVIPNTSFERNFATDLGLPSSILQTKVMSGIFGGILILGMILGGIFFGGSSSAPVQNSGLQGIIKNPDITTRMRRCGTTDNTSACILYIVNHTRYDRLAESFFDDAVKLTGRQKYLISIENPQYAKMKIPPGYFVEVKIPALK